MSSQVRISAQSRSEFGKGASRRLRRSGLVPAVIYGEGTALTHVALPAHDLELALRGPRVVLEVEYDGTTTLVKPRDIQREPVRRILEHVDLVSISKTEAKERSEIADAIKAAEEAAVEAGIDPAAAAAAVEEAIAHGESAADAASHALADVQEQTEAYADAARAEDVAEAAADAADAAAAAAPAAE